MRPFWAIVLLSLAACDVGGTAPSVDAARATDLLVVGSDGRTYLGYPATITVAKGSPDPVEIVFEGRDGGGARFSGLAEVSLEDFMGGRASIELGRVGNGPGSGVAGLFDEPLDKPGTMTLRFLPDQRLDAQVISDHAEISAHVSGRYLLECLVPPEDLGLPAGGPARADVEFRSPFCRPFAPR